MPLSKIIEEQLKEFEEKYYLRPKAMSDKFHCDVLKDLFSASITKACEEMAEEIQKLVIEDVPQRYQNRLLDYLKQEEFFKK